MDKKRRHKLNLRNRQPSGEARRGSGSDRAKRDYLISQKERHERGKLLGLALSYVA